MPDGVNIPGGPGFAGTPQPPDVPCDPTGEGWRGPPGPQGAPGTDTGIGEAPTDGAVYGRQGSSTSWLGVNSTAAGGPFLPLHGGNIVPGPLNVGTDSTGGLTTFAFNTTNPHNSTGALMLNRNGPTTASDDPQIHSRLVMTHNGGSGVSPHVNFTTSVSGNTATWSLLNQSDFSSNDTSPGFGHVGLYSQQVRTGVNTGGTQGIGAWSGIFELRSQTGLPSSQDGILQTLELDLLANGADDHTPGTGRTVISCVIGQNNTSGAAVEVSYGLSFFLMAGSTGHYRNMVGAAAPFSNSVLGTVGATQMSGANAIWLNDGHHVAWNSAGTAQTYWDTGITGVHHIGAHQFDNTLTSQGGATAKAIGTSGWSSDNIGKQLLISSPGGNPGIGITDNAGANIYAIVNAFGQIIFSKMPALTDSTTAPTYLLALSPTLNSTGAVPWKFASTVGFNNTTPIAKPTVTGSKGANAALTSLLTALAAYGLVTDSST